jgi:prepilin-type N-terminal cleavage/methylation domain-containing protein
MSRRGITLVELLVVITIAVVLLAAAAPMFRQGVEERKLVGGTRGLSGVILKAKALAAEYGRPIGIAIERLDTSDPLANPIGAMQSVQVYVVEVPIPYTGDMDDATCFLRDMNHGVGADGEWGVANVDDDGDSNVDNITDRGAPWSDDGDGMPETATFAPILGSEGARVLADPGDLIRFNFRGPLYKIIAKNRITPTITDLVFVHAETIWGNGANGVPNGGVYGSDDIWVSPAAPQAAFKEARFQIYRSPIRTLSAPYSLPTGITIDLSVSGLGPSGGEFGAMPAGVFNHPVVIMFTPTGEVDYIWFNGRRSRAQQPIHLLVGKAELVSPPNPGNLLGTLANVINFDDFNGNGQREGAEEVFSNLMAGDDTSWVSIGHRNGLVTVSDNETITLNNALADPQKIADAIAQSRLSAVKSQSYGGR